MPAVRLLRDDVADADFAYVDTVSSDWNVAAKGESAEAKTLSDVVATQARSFEDSRSAAWEQFALDTLTTSNTTTASLLNLDRSAGEDTATELADLLAGVIDEEDNLSSDALTEWQSARLTLTQIDDAIAIAAADLMAADTVSHATLEYDAVAGTAPSLSQLSTPQAPSSNDSAQSGSASGSSGDSGTATSTAGTTKSSLFAQSSLFADSSAPAEPDTSFLGRLASALRRMATPAPLLDLDVDEKKEQLRIPDWAVPKFASPVSVALQKPGDDKLEERLNDPEAKHAGKLQELRSLQELLVDLESDDPNERSEAEQEFIRRLQLASPEPLRMPGFFESQAMTVSTGLNELDNAGFLIRNLSAPLREVGMIILPVLEGAAATEAHLETSRSLESDAVFLLGTLSQGLLGETIGRGLGERLNPVAFERGDRAGDGAAVVAGVFVPFLPKGKVVPNRSALTAETSQLGRLRLAMRFLKDNKYFDGTTWRSLSPSQRREIISGIDLSKPVQITTLEPGTVLLQDVRIGGVPGPWYRFPATSASEVGIWSVGRETIRFRTTLPTQVLESHARPIVDYWTRKGFSVPTEGGGIQLYIFQGYKIWPF